MQSFTHLDLSGEFMGVKLPTLIHADSQAVLFRGIKYELGYLKLGKYCGNTCYMMMKAHVHWKHTQYLHLFIFYEILFARKSGDLKKKIYLFFLLLLENTFKQPVYETLEFLSV